jgi:hypothetical protein
LFEGEARLQAVSVHRFVYGVPIPALGISASQVIENVGFGVIQIGQAKILFRGLYFLRRKRFSSSLAALHEEVRP